MYLIKSDFLAEHTRIKQGTSWEVLEPYFKDVQDIYVQDLLGIPLLELYVDHILNDTVISSFKVSLLEDVKKYMAKRIEYEYALLGNVNLNNSGVRTDTAGDLAIINKVRDVIAEQFTHYEERIKLYLNKHKTEFPEFFGNVEESVTKNTSYLGFSFKPLVKKRYY